MHKHTGSAVSLGKTLKQPRRMDTLRNVHEIIMQIKTTSQEQTEKSYVHTVTGFTPYDTLEETNNRDRIHWLLEVIGYAHMKNMGLQSVKLFFRVLQ